MSASADAVLGVDLGTSLVKAGIYFLDGTMQATASHPIALHRSPQGRTEQDLDEFYRAAAAATRQCLRGSGFAPQRIGAIAVAGQMAGVGIVDDEHRPLASFDSWLDTRCSDVVDELSSTVGDRITAVAGCPPTISIGPKMVWWRRHEPALCAEAAAFVPDPSNQPAYDAAYGRYRRWSDHLVEGYRREAAHSHEQRTGEMT